MAVAACFVGRWQEECMVVSGARFGRLRKQMPCHMRSCRLLARVDAQMRDELLAAWLIRWEAPSLRKGARRTHAGAGRGMGPGGCA